MSVGGDNYGGEYYFVSFTPSNTVTLTDAITDMLWFTGQTSLNAYLLADNGGMPGAVLDSMNQFGPVGNGLVTFTCSLNCPILESSSVYWLELQETDPNTSEGWYLSSTDFSDGSDYALRYTYYGPQSGTYWPTGPRNVFEIDGTPLSDPPSALLSSDPDPVSEPPMAIMLLLGLAVVAGFFAASAPRNTDQHL